MFSRAAEGQILTWRITVNQGIPDYACLKSPYELLFEIRDVDINCAARRIRTRKAWRYCNDGSIYIPRGIDKSWAEPPPLSEAEAKVNEACSKYKETRRAAAAAADDEREQKRQALADEREQKRQALADKALARREAEKKKREELEARRQERIDAAANLRKAAQVARREKQAAEDAARQATEREAAAKMAPVIEAKRREQMIADFKQDVERAEAEGRIPPSIPSALKDKNGIPFPELKDLLQGDCPGAPVDDHWEEISCINHVAVFLNVGTIEAPDPTARLVLAEFADKEARARVQIRVLCNKGKLVPLGFRASDSKSGETSGAESLPGSFKKLMSRRIVTVKNVPSLESLLGASCTLDPKGVTHRPSPFD